MARKVPLNLSGATSTRSGIPGTGTAGRALAVELVQGAGRRRLVVAPAPHLGPVADPAVGDVVEGHLDDELGPEADPLEVAAGRPPRGLARPALAGLVRRERGDELALLAGREARGVADLAQTAVLAVEAQDERPERALGLARAPAHDDRVDRPDALDLDHADPLARAVGGAGLLGDHALLLVQPALGLGGAADDRGQLEALERLERGAALEVGQLEQHVVVAGEQVEGDQARGRLGRESVDARLRRVDALAEGVEGGRDDLAVEHVAAGRQRRRHLGEVAGQPLAVARLQLDLVAVHEGDGAEAVELGLVGPAVARGQRVTRARELREDGGPERERHGRAA